MIQLVATGAAGFPLVVHIRGGDVPMPELISSGILTCTAATACWALWYYAQRYVGELALIVPSSKAGSNAAELSLERAAPQQSSNGDSEAPEGCNLDQLEVQWVQISTLDFWGARQV
jgi:hypothetical protein